MMPSTRPWPVRAGRERHPVTPALALVGNALLDRHVVSGARYEAYLAAAGLETRPLPYAGRHPRISALIAETGWLRGWNAELPANAAAFRTRYHDEKGTDFGPAVQRANLTWYEAFAFCIWDGGRLPTEAEWLFAAYGGTQGRIFPWQEFPGTPAPNACPGIPSDSPPTAGDAFGLENLGIGSDEWMFDAAGNMGARVFEPADCHTTECVGLASPLSRRVYGGEGGAFSSGTFRARSAEGPTGRHAFRCAHDVAP
jgi:formylglycine-generating enzyme required for sulfatase activity